MSSKNGYIGSLIVHLAVVGAAVAFAAMKPDVKTSDGQDPLLLEVWTGDGSDRAPGIPGRNRGAAQGHAQGNKLKTGLPRIKALDSKALLRDLKEAEQRAAAEEREAREAKAEKAAPDKTAKPDKRESLEDFRKATGKTTRTGKGTASTPSAGASKAGGKATSGISGARVGSLSGTGSGEPGFGRANGKGANGGDGGSGDALKLFYGDITGKFSDAYQPLFEDMGGGLDGTRDAGVVRLGISPSGHVTFMGWSRPPADPLMEKIVKAAIAKMPPVRRPPSGKAEVVLVPVSGKVDE